MIYHSSSNLQATIANNMHMFTIPVTVKVDVQVSNPQRLTGTVQLLNSSGVVVFDGTSQQGGTITLPAGQYRWSIVGGPTPVLGSTGHVAGVVDTISTH
jgi:hypothetical protein